MQDRVSQYRQIRLTITPSEGSDRAYWHVLAMTVRGGVPSSKILTDGFIEWDHDRDPVTMIEDALDEAVDAAGRGLRR